MASFEGLTMDSKVWLAWHGSWDSRYLIGVYASREGALAAIAAANDEEIKHIEDLNESGRYGFEPDLADESDVHEEMVQS